MIPYGRHYIDESDVDAVVQILRTGALTQGPAVDAFERAVADYVGAKYAVAVSSATAGLHLAALAAGVGSGAALVTSPITFVASANAAHYAGGVAHFADIDEDTVNLSPQALTEVLDRQPNVRAVVPVHFGGLPCDVESIHHAASGVGAVVIEDAAHALGATYPDGRRVGCCTHSLMTVFSFHPVKLIAAGEGGLITTNDERIYRHLQRLRSHGINKFGDTLFRDELSKTGEMPNPWYYEMQELGYHYRITDIQCALASSQLKKLDRFIERRRQLAIAYDNAFSKFKYLKPAQSMSRHASSLHLYVTRIDFDKAGISRAELMFALRERGVGSQVHYIPVTDHPFYHRLGHKTSSFVNATNFYHQALSIPLYYGLTDEQQHLVVDSLREFVG